ncbi:MAG: PQQ-dependent sugar dehydrogenase [Gemmatimonadaceae bacterium]
MVSGNPWRAGDRVQPAGRLSGTPDFGKLYVSVGDGGSVENKHAELVHSKDKVWGTVLRIDPAGRNSSNGQYGIPSETRWPMPPRAAAELYAYGFRNPHRLAWSSTGARWSTSGRTTSSR